MIHGNVPGTTRADKKAVGSNNKNLNKSVNELIKILKYVIIPESE